MKNKQILSVFILFLSLIFCSTLKAKELCDCYGSCIKLYERDLTQATKTFIKNRDGYSGKNKIEIDHKIPLCLGGSNSVNNLQALPKAVHLKKTKHDMQLLDGVNNCRLSVFEAYQSAKKYKP